MLHEGKGALFTDIAYEVSVRQLIDDGYLCPLVSKAAETRLDVSGVGSRGGEFIPGQLQAAVDLPEITEAAIDEVVRLGADRRSWLAFCAGVEHATHVAEAIRARGFSAATIFGDTPKPERDRMIAAFKRGEIRALASMGVLTTGFNAPGVDLIAMLRPTKSTGLYVQMAGRGTRLAPGKDELPGARLRRQRRAARADRCGEAEAPRQRRGRRAGQGLIRTAPTRLIEQLRFVGRGRWAYPVR